MKIGIIKIGNATSVQNALKKLRIDSIISNDENELTTCIGIILPGVGAFGNGMKTIEKLAPFIKKLDKPLLGICLGMQLLFEESEERPGVRGLGLIKGSVKKFSGVRTPQIGWNKIENTHGALFEQEGRVYFVNSYYCAPEELVTTSTANYGINFTASIQKNNLYGVQFHPEKSGVFGLAILERFARLCK